MKNSKKKLIVVLLIILIAGIGIYYHTWRESFILPPVMDAQNNFLSHPDNFWPDKKIMPPTP